MTELRVPPHNLEAEQAVLGGLMLSNESWFEIAGKVKPEDFYRRDHRLIFGAIQKLATAMKPFDVVTLKDTLDENEIERGYLIHLAKDTPSAANIRHYAEIVREKSLRRELIEQGTRIAQRGWNAEDLTAALDESHQSLIGLSRPKGTGPRKLIDAFSALADRLEELNESGGMMGLPTGFTDLDRLTSGMERGDLWYIGARPSMGKSAMAMAVSEACKGRSLFFSLEMPHYQLLSRTLASRGRFPLTRMRQGLHDDDWPRMTEASKQAATMELYVDDTPALTVMDMRARAWRLAAEKPLDLIVVDHLHLVRSDGDGRTHELEKVSNALKAMAKDLDCPVLCLCQLNRNLESRPDKRPMLSDLRQCGAIEQDGDVILFLYRDFVYSGEWPNVAELNCAKQRNGPLGQVLLYFDDETTRFGNLDRAEAEHYRRSTRTHKPKRSSGFDYDEEVA